MTRKACVARGVAHLAVAASLLLTSCGDPATTGSTPDQRLHHADGDAVLSAGTRGGGAFVAAPPPSGGEWAMTYGAFVLCTQDGVPATLERVSLTEPGAGAAATPYLRSVPSQQQRQPGRDYAPGVLRGRPESTEPPMGGDFEADVAGAEITRSYDQPPGPEEAREEVVIVMEADERGAEVDGFSVAYSADGRDYVLDVDYQLVMCGQEVHDESC